VQNFSGFTRLCWTKCGRLQYGPGLADGDLTDQSIRLLITGLLFAGSGSLVAISPLGKLSGGRVTSPPCRHSGQGKMHHHDIVGYIVGQVLSAIMGAALLVFVWKGYAASVTNGMTLPGPPPLVCIFS